MVGPCYQYCDVKRFILFYEAYHIRPMIKSIQCHTVNGTVAYMRYKGNSAAEAHYPGR